MCMHIQQKSHCPVAIVQYSCPTRSEKKKSLFVKELNFGLSRVYKIKKQKSIANTIRDPSYN